MIKKYLFYIYLLSASTLFAYKEIKIAIPTRSEPRAVIPTHYKLPLGFTLEACTFQTYKEMNASLQHIIEYLWLGNNEEVKASIYKEIKGEKEEYIILEFPLMRVTEGVSTNYYCFVWKKKKYSEATDTERKIAQHYGVSNKPKIKFLYSYSKPNTDPWAIMVDHRIHATIWVKTQTTVKPSNMISKDPFLVIDSKDEDSSINVLINENNQIIAKRINGMTVFR